MKANTEASSWRRIALLSTAGLLVAGLIAALVVAHYADPMVRRRIISSVEERLSTTATLDEVHVTFRPGLRVEGRGLHIAGTGQQPSIEVRSFQFATHLSTIFAQDTTLVTVAVDGLSIVIPPGEDNAAPAPAPTGHTHGEHGRFKIAEVLATNSEIVVQNRDATRYPLAFELSNLKFDDRGDGQPVHFEAMLENLKGIGEIHVHGLLGPCNPQQPRETPVSARFDFANADLHAIDGVQGHAFGQGTIGGTVGMLLLEGDASVADFGMAPGLLRVALTSHFQANVDALTGLVTVPAVSAHLLQTDMTAHGTISRISAGHKVELVSELHGRAEDLLNLISPTRTKPLLSAALMDSATIHIPPGRRPMLLKMSSSGAATLTNTHWSDADVQQQVDALSLKARAEAKVAAEHPDDLPAVPTTLQNTFTLQEGVLQMNGISYRMPGATVLMDGSYNLQTETMNTHGIVRTAAKASQMTTGLKSLLLKPLDPLLRKPGAGMQMPVELTGPKSDLHLGLDLSHWKSDERVVQK